MAAHTLVAVTPFSEHWVRGHGWVTARMDDLCLDGEPSGSEAAWIVPTDLALEDAGLELVAEPHIWVEPPPKPKKQKKEVTKADEPEKAAASEGDEEFGLDEPPTKKRKTAAKQPAAKKTATTKPVALQEVSANVPTRIQPSRKKK
ncbi:unnamed protein product [Zymoseptoria tritici ST99CH_3D1]|nr:unnamed protein product [Zymoseptoria tritici ST99CH_3D1]